MSISNDAWRALRIARDFARAGYTVESYYADRMETTLNRDHPDNDGYHDDSYVSYWISRVKEICFYIDCVQHEYEEKV